jgi:hypothetical protein
MRVMVRYVRESTLATPAMATAALTLCVLCLALDNEHAPAICTMRDLVLHANKSIIA